MPLQMTVFRAASASSRRGKAGNGEQRVIIFFAHVLLLIVVGRLLSEWMQRFGQRSDRPIARGDYPRAERFWFDLALRDNKRSFAA